MKGKKGKGWVRKLKHCVYTTTLFDGRETSQTLRHEQTIPQEDSNLKSVISASDYIPYISYIPYIGYITYSTDSRHEMKMQRLRWTWRDWACVHELISLLLPPSGLSPEER